MNFITLQSETFKQDGGMKNLHPPISKLSPAPLPCHFFSLGVNSLLP